MVDEEKFFIIRKSYREKPKGLLSMDTFNTRNKKNTSVKWVTSYIYL